MKMVVGKLFFVLLNMNTDGNIMIDIEVIKDSYDYYKNDIPYHLYIHMRALDGTCDDPYLNEAANIFKYFGFNYEFADTYMFDFNLNNDWYTFDCPECIRDYGFSIPIVDDIEKIARFVELVYDGKIVVVIEEVS